MRNLLGNIHLHLSRARALQVRRCSGRRVGWVGLLFICEDAITLFPILQASIANEPLSLLSTPLLVPEFSTLSYWHVQWLVVPVFCPAPGYPVQRSFPCGDCHHGDCACESSISILEAICRGPPLFAGHHDVRFVLLKSRKRSKLRIGK